MSENQEKRTIQTIVVHRITNLLVHCVHYEKNEINCKFYGMENTKYFVYSKK